MPDGPQQRTSSSRNTVADVNAPNDVPPKRLADNSPHTVGRGTPPRRRPFRHALLVLSAAALAGCGSGQVAQTALGDSSVSGLNAQNADGSVLIRNLAVAYNGTAGYPAGADAALELHLFNQTTDTLTVQVGSQPPQRQTSRTGIVSARSVTITGEQHLRLPTAEPEPSTSGRSKPSANPTNPPLALTPAESPTGLSARIDLAPLGYTAYRPGDRKALKAMELADRLAPGNTLNLIFTFSNGTAPLIVQAPVATPLSPAPRAPAVALPPPPGILR